MHTHTHQVTEGLLWKSSVNINCVARATVTFAVQCFGPLALFHVEGKEKVEEGATSIINEMEAEFVLWLYMCALPGPHPLTLQVNDGNCIFPC